MGFPFKSFFDILQMVAPVVLLAVPGAGALAPIVPIIIKGIADAEALPGATGDQKKQHVMQLVADGAAAANVVKPGTIDVATATDAADEAVDAVVGATNAVLIAHKNAAPIAPAA